MRLCGQVGLHNLSCIILSQPGTFGNDGTLSNELLLLLLLLQGIPKVGIFRCSFE